MLFASVIAYVIFCSELSYLCAELALAYTFCSSNSTENQCLHTGVFLAVSSNTRYQIINGLERVVESSPVTKRLPPVAMAFTVGVRFANNIYGGMQFVDWARWSGVQ